MATTRRKPNSRYLLYRVYCVAALVIWNAVGLRDVVSGGHGESLGPFIPMMLPALFMVFNLMVFRFPYSVFGQLERSKAPTEQEIAVSRFTSGSVGGFPATAPFFTWKLHSSGIAFSILAVGTGFVPFAQVKAVEDGWLGFKVLIESAEVRGPLSFASRTFYDAVKNEFEGPDAGRTPIKPG
jgi:hypothetical protein